MPDYASILRRSVSALPDPSPEMREAVYQRARAALARQLTAVDPPLSTREIETQHQELEDAVARLEAEYAPPRSRPSRSSPTVSRRTSFLYPRRQPAAPPIASRAGAAKRPGRARPRYDAKTTSEDEDDDDLTTRSARRACRS